MSRQSDDVMITTFAVTATADALLDRHEITFTATSFVTANDDWLKRI